MECVIDRRGITIQLPYTTLYAFVVMKSKLYISSKKLVNSGAGNAA
jgi:hypothetical protein